MCVHHYIITLLVKKPYSASTMFAAHGIPSFCELFRTSIYWFAGRVCKNSNSIIIACILIIIIICGNVYWPTKMQCVTYNDFKYYIKLSEM